MPVNIQVKNVPVEIHRRLVREARRRGRPLRDLVLEALEREAARVAFRERLAKRDPVEDLGETGSLVDDARSERERELR